jgi:hypothetical protein
VSGLLDITVGMRRLEAKLEKIAESVLQRQSSLVTENAVQGVLHTELLGSGSWKQPHTSETDSGQVIVKVCTGEGSSTGNLVSGQVIKPAPIPYQLSRGSWSDANPTSERQGAAELSEQQTPTQLAEQQKIVDPLEQLMANEQSVPQTSVERSFRRKQREINLLQEKGASFKESRKALLTTDFVDVDKKLEALSESLGKKLERIAYALGIRNLNVVDNSADDAEDRKRLMEKLKFAFDNDRRKRLSKSKSDGEKWLNYIFGICKPDQRIGKRGSRYGFSVAFKQLNCFGHIFGMSNYNTHLVSVCCAGLFIQNLDSPKVSGCNKCF